MWFLGGTLKFLRHKLEERDNVKMSIKKKCDLGVDEGGKVRKNIFPKYRANVEEGYGTIYDGVYEYYCNNCKNIIVNDRYRITNKEDFDLCSNCFFYFMDDIEFDGKFTYTIRNERDAELREIDRLINIIFRDYNNDEEGIMIDFNDFLSAKLLKGYNHTIWRYESLRNWLKIFNSYTLHKFTQFHFYKKNKYIKKSYEYNWPNISIY